MCANQMGIGLERLLDVNVASTEPNGQRIMNYEHVIFRTNYYYCQLYAFHKHLVKTGSTRSENESDHSVHDYSKMSPTVW